MFSKYTLASKILKKYIINFDYNILKNKQKMHLIYCTDIYTYIVILGVYIKWF